MGTAVFATVPISYLLRAGYAAILRHASAHFRHASAQRLHCSVPHFSHSTAQRSQMSAQASQNCPAQTDSRQQLDAQSQHILAQSMQAFAQSALLPMQFLAQASHSFAQATQASMHVCRFSFSFFIFIPYLCCCSGIIRFGVPHRHFWGHLKNGSHRPSSNSARRCVHVCGAGQVVWQVLRSRFAERIQYLLLYP